MPPGAQASEQRNRLDHILPQGYLEGFTSPSDQGNLCVFDRERQRWFESGTRNVGAVRGFYDYAPGSAPDQTADEAFARLENQFPNVRRELVSTAFSAWTSHLDFLLEYAQMLRARSKLFREHALLDARQSTMLVVEDVLQEPGRTKLKVKPFVASEADREILLRNMTITKMRGEIAVGSGLFSQLHWCLRLTSDSTSPVITADDPVIVQGRVPTLEPALRDHETLFFFPLCWQACLIGSLAKFETETEAFHQSDLRTLQMRYLNSDSRFVYSPTRIALPEAR
jgi:hypothetical protein